MSDIITAMLGGLGVGSIYALVALGFSFILKMTDSFNFAQGMLVSLGGLFTYTIYMLLGWPTALTLLAVVVIVAVFGGIIERVAVFPLARRGDPPLLWLMSTLGISLIGVGIASRIWGSQPLGVDNYIGDPVTHLGDAYVSTPYILAFIGSLLAAAAITMLQRFTTAGRIMRAIADNRQAVQISGINVLWYSLAAYAIGAALAGFAGFLIAPIVFASANGSFSFTMLGFAALAMGGFGSHWGALLGGWIVGLVQALGAFALGLQFQDFLVFAVLVVILMIRPSGIFTFGNVRNV